MFESSWQDAVLMGGNIIFLAALVPSLIGEHKPSKWTSLVNAVALSIFAVIYFSLTLTYTTISTLIIAIAWWVLFYQKW